MSSNISSHHDHSASLNQSKASSTLQLELDNTTKLSNDLTHSSPNEYSSPCVLISSPPSCSPSSHPSWPRQVVFQSLWKDATTSATNLATKWWKLLMAVSYACNQAISASITETTRTSEALANWMYASNRWSAPTFPKPSRSTKKWPRSGRWAKPLDRETLRRAKNTSSIKMIWYIVLSIPSQIAKGRKSPYLIWWMIMGYWLGVVMGVI